MGYIIDVRYMGYIIDVLSLYNIMIITHNLYFLLNFEIKFNVDLARSGKIVNRLLNVNTTFQNKFPRVFQVLTISRKDILL